MHRSPTTVQFLLSSGLFRPKSIEKISKRIFTKLAHPNAHAIYILTDSAIKWDLIYKLCKCNCHTCNWTFHIPFQTAACLSTTTCTFFVYRTNSKHNRNSCLCLIFVLLNFTLWSLILHQTSLTGRQCQIFAL